MKKELKTKVEIEGRSADRAGRVCLRK